MASHLQLISHCPTIRSASNRDLNRISSSRISQEDWETAQRDLEMGVPKSKMAQRLNISRTTLYKLLDEGLPITLNT
ncbi:helix-turn-helix domain-containing protein [Corynebacterium resistens]|uniref:helix-turn-helix domain-containing protein n=1 Tax=Corynebacterium resistens TaxID=258224 RepID=UPI0011D2575D